MDSSKIEFYKRSVDYILKVQNQDGSIPWEVNKKLDPWDHIERLPWGSQSQERKEEAERCFFYGCRQISCVWDGSW